MILSSHFEVDRDPHKSYTQPTNIERKGINRFRRASINTSNTLQLLRPAAMAQIPYPHSSSGPSQFSPAPEDARTNEFRNATNFRSVTRNDPSTQEILETSVYSVIYHYDETVGWEKQKQEGPLFVVRR